MTTRQIVSRVGNYVICQGMAADAGLWFTQRGKEVKEFFSREEAEKFAGAQDAGREGQRVKILGGMKEFVGKTGTVVMNEGGMYRVRLDNPVDIPGVGKVSDDLWEGNLLRKIG